MHIHGDDAAQSARDGAEGEFGQDQPGKGEIAADHGEHEIGEHDGKNPRKESFEPALFAAERKEAAEEDGERLDALIDGLNDGLGEGREFENEREDKDGRKAEEDREQDGLGDLNEMSGQRIFRLHDKKDTSA